MFQQTIAAENLFLKDVMALRAAAQALLGSPPPPATALLQTALSVEIACVLRYTMMAVSPDGLKNDWVSAEFLEQAKDERKHMSLLAERITQLGGVPDFGPESLAFRAAPLQGQRTSFTTRVQENLAAETCVTEHYKALIGHFSKTDHLTAALLEDIMRDEEDHASDMEDLLAAYGG